MPYRAIIVYRPTLPGTALFLVQAEVLANHRGKKEKKSWYQYVFLEVVRQNDAADGREGLELDASYRHDNASIAASRIRLWRR
jgi:hypothetical protein